MTELHEAKAEGVKATVEADEAKPKLFYSFADEDDALRAELERHLAGLRRSDRSSDWHHRRVGAGEPWRGRVDEHLREADIILLLVSSDFLASDYCWDVEMTRALARHDEGTALVIPILLRACDWRQAHFARLAPLPANETPVTLWDDRDEAWASVAAGIRGAIQKRASKKPTTATSAPGPPGPGAPGTPASGPAPASERLDRKAQQLWRWVLSTQDPRPKIGIFLACLASVLLVAGTHVLTPWRTLEQWDAYLGSDASKFTRGWLLFIQGITCGALALFTPENRFRPSVTPEARTATNNIRGSVRALFGTWTFYYLTRALTLFFLPPKDLRAILLENAFGTPNTIMLFWLYVELTCITVGREQAVDGEPSSTARSYRISGIGACIVAVGGTVVAQVVFGIGDRMDLHRITELFLGSMCGAAIAMVVGRLGSLEPSTLTLGALCAYAMIQPFATYRRDHASVDLMLSTTAFVLKIWFYLFFAWTFTAGSLAEHVARARRVRGADA